MLWIRQLLSGLGLHAYLAWADPTLPTVNLGYERHQAIQFNTLLTKGNKDSAQTYNFSNIRFAQAPINSLRFKSPVPAWAAPNSSTVNNGSIGAICPQASGNWEAIAQAFVPKYLAGQAFNKTASHLGPGSNTSQSVQVDHRISEDCLFLDVVVPQSIFERTTGDCAPVLVWLYGGGFTTGEKTGSGQYNPYGLFEKAQAVTGEKFVWVALNYRLGAFGWLSGPTLQQLGGTANAGLYDQRTALEWVQRYIHLFGGDPSRVTIMGESAGASSIMHQITAFDAHDQPPLFSQAIIQSPAWHPMVSSTAQETIYGDFLALANVTSLTEAQALSTNQLQLANAMQVASASYGDAIYAPVVDGVFARELPGRALLSRNFNPNLRVLIGHNGDEGLYFTSPDITTDAAYDNLIASSFPDYSQQFRNELTQNLYPPIYNGSHGYTTPFERARLTIEDYVFTCNTFYLADSFKNNAYNYKFNVSPALHADDLRYTFAGHDLTAGQAPNVVAALQEYIVSFVATGNPSNAAAIHTDTPRFPAYGTNRTVVVLDNNITYARDDLAGPRCRFWQTAL